MGSTLTDSRYMLDQMRHSQYVSRYTLAHPPPLDPVKMVAVGPPPVSRHQDFFVQELTAEVNELKSRQRDYHALQDQFRYLTEQYKQVQFEK